MDHSQTFPPGRDDPHVLPKSGYDLVDALPKVREDYDAAGRYAGPRGASVSGLEVLQKDPLHLNHLWVLAAAVHQARQALPELGRRVPKKQQQRERKHE